MALNLNSEIVRTAYQYIILVFSISNCLWCYLILLQGASELLAGASILGCSADDFVNDVSLIKNKHDK